MFGYRDNARVCNQCGYRTPIWAPIFGTILVMAIMTALVLVLRLGWNVGTRPPLPPPSPPPPKLCADGAAVISTTMTFTCDHEATISVMPVGPDGHVVVVCKCPHKED
jgi:hypothetical protein